MGSVKHVRVALVGLFAIGTGCGGAGVPTTTGEQQGALAHVAVDVPNDSQTKPDSPAAGASDTAEGPSLVTSGRMTGGGRVRTAEVSVSHGFELHCEVANHSQNVEVNWAGHRFHLTQLGHTTCANLGGLDEGTPAAGFDTIAGEGVGRLDGKDGATIQFIFADGGEPGRKDLAAIAIADADGALVLNASGPLSFGNQQAHKETGAP